MIADEDGAAAVARIAAAIGEPARAHMLYCLMDGRARTSTELAIAAGVSPSTASAHLSRLKLDGLIDSAAQGKHRYYRIESRDVAHALEGLSVLAGGARPLFRPTAPHRLRAARSCYDHIAGAVGVALHGRLQAMGWITPESGSGGGYELTPLGTRALEGLGVDVAATRALRRRFACACLDWSERRPHLGGALAAALFKIALARKWVAQDPDCRALSVTAWGRRELRARFGIEC